MSLISETKTDDGLRVLGQRGEPVSGGARPSCRTPRDPDGGDQGSKFTAEDGGEIRSTAVRVCYCKMSAARDKRSSRSWPAEG